MRDAIDKDEVDRICLVVLCNAVFAYIEDSRSGLSGHPLGG